MVWLHGNEYDDETHLNLYSYVVRHMDPALGRFTTPDPVRDFVNPYSYVRNNPMNRIDPTGAWSNNPKYGSCTGYDFGQSDPFWWVDPDVYKEWLRANTSQAEIDWRNSLVDDGKEAADFPSGIYFARLETGEQSDSIRMILLK